MFLGRNGTIATRLGITMSYGLPSGTMAKSPNARVIAGHDRNESITQPQWGGNDPLFFVGDRTGFWQRYQLVDGKGRYILVNRLGRAELTLQSGG